VPKPAQEGIAGKAGVSATARPAAAAVGGATQVGKPPENEIEATLADLASGNKTTVGTRLTLLSETAPAQPSPQVAKALESVLLGSTDSSHRIAAAKALINWSTEESVPVMLRTLTADRSPMVARPLIEAVMKYKPESAIEPIAHLLSNIAMRRDAGQALRTFGPVAEDAVIAQLGIGDSFARREACDVLAAIKTIRQAQRVAPKAGK
jgi:hypothetical protein